MNTVAPDQATAALSIHGAKRLVIKIGSALLADDNGNLRSAWIDSLVLMLSTAAVGAVLKTWRFRLAARMDALRLQMDQSETERDGSSMKKILHVRGKIDENVEDIHPEKEKEEKAGILSQDIALPNHHSSAPLLNNDIDLIERMRMIGWGMR